MPGDDHARRKRAQILGDDVDRADHRTLNEERCSAARRPWTHDGTFAVHANLWWGTNATRYRFFGNGVQVGQGDLVAATPSAQQASLDVTGKRAGVYEYGVEFVNALGSTRSTPLSVTVQ
jgi:hypothetical protein